MKYLFLIDRKFPFKKGEAFLENELEYLSTEFDQVLIFPIDTSKSDQQTRSVNFNNVTSFKLNRLGTKYKKITDTFFGLKYFPQNYKNRGKSSFQALELSAVKYIVDDRVGKIRKILDNMTFNKNDEIYIYSYWLYTTAYIATEVKNYFSERDLKSIVISRAHRFDIYEETRWNGIVPFQQEMVEKLDQVFSISENGKEYLQGKYPHISNKIKTSRLGTIDRGISNRDTTSNIFHILSVSWIEDRKRLDLIIKSLSNIDLKGKKLLWTHIGSGKMEQKIKKLANKFLKVEEFEFLGVKPNLEVYNYYINNSIDLFINVSSSEGIPVSIMEAISFGVPVVATDVGGTSEIITDGANGYLLDKDFQLEDFREKVTYLAGLNDKEVEAYRNKARQLWEEKYQSKQNYEEFVESIKKEYT